MKKELQGLKWKPMWTSLMGSIKGCVDYLGLDISGDWLMGGTGHGFIINMHEVVCLSGPTAWNMGRVIELGKNLGYEVNGVWGMKTDPDFGQKKRKAFDLVKSSIDQGIPCYAWELKIPEYYVIHGYDEKAYWFSGVEADPDTKPWDALGETEIGILEVNSISPVKAADDRTVVKQALEFALKFAQSPEGWVFPKYRAGLDGFDLWIKALENRTALDMGMAYNAEVWHECRRGAAGFLREAEERIGGKVGPLLDQAAGHYDTVANHLKEVVMTFPFPIEGRKLRDTKEPGLRDAGLKSLRNAREAEAKGLSALEKIIGAL